MFEVKTSACFTICLSAAIALLSFSCEDSNRTKEVCLDYMEKAAECTISDEETRELYMYENRATCEDISEDSWNYQKIYPCRKQKECADFLACVDANTSQEPESSADGDVSSSSSDTDGDTSDICDRQCTCSCSCGDSTLTTIDGCLDCIADCETECESFCGDEA